MLQLLYIFVLNDILGALPLAYGEGGIGQKNNLKLFQDIYKNFTVKYNRK